MTITTLVRIVTAFVTILTALSTSDVVALTGFMEAMTAVNRTEMDFSGPLTTVGARTRSVSSEAEPSDDTLRMLEKRSHEVCEGGANRFYSGRHPNGMQGKTLGYQSEG